MRKIFLGNLLLAIILLSCQCIKEPRTIVKHLFNEKSNEWNLSKIDYSFEHVNYYAQILTDCKLLESDNLKKINSYMLKFEDSVNVMVELLCLNNEISANKFFEKAKIYAETIRMTPREQYRNLCQPIREWDFHYVYQNKNYVYLVGTISGPLKFEDGSVSLESEGKFLYQSKLVYQYIQEFYNKNER